MLLVISLNIGGSKEITVGQMNKDKLETLLTMMKNVWR